MSLSNILLIPGVGGDSVNALRRLLFPDSEKGGMWTSLRKNSLWRDVSAATPITEFGQPVARMDDLSGNGNHFTRSVEANRPDYYLGAVPFLRFNGTTDSMQTGTVDFDGAGEVTTIAVILDRNDATAVFVESGTTSSLSNRMALFSPQSLLDNYAYRVRGVPPSDSLAISASDYTRPDFAVLVGTGGAGQQTGLERNSIIIATETVSDIVSLENTALYLGARAGTSLYSEMDFAFLAIVAGRVQPDAIDAAVQILSAKTKTIPKIKARLGTERLDAMYSWWQGPYVQDTPIGSWVCSTNDAANQNVTNIDVGTNFNLGSDTKDDHIAPAILHNAGKPPIAAYHKRTGTALYWRKGTTSGDFSTLGSENTKDSGVDVDYTRIIYHEQSDDIYVFMRSQNQRWVFFKSTDYGETFANPVTFLDIGVSGQAYMTFNEVGTNKVRFAVYTHPTSVAAIQDIYFGEINFSTGEVSKADGTVIGTLADDLPFALTDFDLCYDESEDSTATVTRLYAVGNGDVPEVAFAAWNDTTDAEYRYVRWNGSAWVMKTICACGEVFGYTPEIGYYGGVTIPDRSSGHTFVTSREDSGSWYIEKQVSVDSGDNFTATLIKQSNVTKLIRPLFHKHSKYPLTFVEAYVYDSTFTGWQSRLLTVRDWQ